MANGTVLEARDLVVEFPGRRVLDGVSFSIREGELVSLIGPNGAGKTTIFRSVLGLLKPTSGLILTRAKRQSDSATAATTARINGTAATATATSTVAKRAFGYVPQQVSFDRELPLRVKDVVRLGIDGHKFGFSRDRKGREKRIAEVLEETGIPELASKRVGELSGGQQKKVMIAHALAGEPEMMILDEPLANLDLKSQDQVVALLERVSKVKHVAVFLSAHDINPLIPVTDKVIFVSGGKAACGPINEVMNSEVLTSLYGHRVDVFDYHGRMVVLADPEGGHHHDHAEGHGGEGRLNW